MSVQSVHQSDWLAVARVINTPIDFVYADPPFNTGIVKSTPPNATKRGRDVEATYADTFGSNDAFVAWLRERLVVTLPLMQPTGLLAIHVDWRTSHRVRMMLDEVLGEDRFVNHLIWSYGLGGSSPRRFARKHDDILLYCLDPDRYWFDPPRVPATSNRLRGQSKKATDVLDIPAINNMAKERTGYPTQKPLALLDLLVRACCPPDGWVLDPCCGSGTTLVAAAMAGRSAVGVDVSSMAVKTARTRLAKLGRDVPRADGNGGDQALAGPRPQTPAERVR